MARASLRTASIFCLAIWVAVWLLFLLIRFAPLDIRLIPGVGPVMLIALVVAFLAPLVATGFAAAAIVRQPGAPLNWLSLGCGIAALFGQAFIFFSSKWL